MPTSLALFCPPRFRCQGHQRPRRAPPARPLHRNRGGLTVGVWAWGVSRDLRSRSASAVAVACSWPLQGAAGRAGVGRSGPRASGSDQRGARGAAATAAKGPRFGAHPPRRRHGGGSEGPATAAAAPRAPQRSEEHMRERREQAGTRRGLFRGDGPAASGGWDAVSTTRTERSAGGWSGTSECLCICEGSDRAPKHSHEHRSEARSGIYRIAFSSRRRERARPAHGQRLAESFWAAGREARGLAGGRRASLLFARLVTAVRTRPCAPLGELGVAGDAPCGLRWAMDLRPLFAAARATDLIQRVTHRSRVAPPPGGGLFRRNRTHNHWFGWSMIPSSTRVCWVALAWASVARVRMTSSQAVRWVASC